MNIQCNSQMCPEKCTHDPGPCGACDALRDKAETKKPKGQT